MVELQIPALRDRLEDIPEFMRFFSQLYAERYDRNVWEPDGETLKAFCDYSWPGNIRQLSHVIEQSYVLDCEPSLPNKRSSISIEDRLPYFDLGKLRTTAVRQALKTTKGHKGKAAKLLGVHANTLTRMLADIKQEDQEAEQEAATV
ncbi:helix-turn-helix domain-containing protein [Planctomycetota bacterium]